MSFSGLNSDDKMKIHYKIFIKSAQKLVCECPCYITHMRLPHLKKNDMKANTMDPYQPH